MAAQPKLRILGAGVTVAVDKARRRALLPIGTENQTDDKTGGKTGKSRQTRGAFPGVQRLFQRGIMTDPFPTRRGMPPRESIFACVRQ